MSCKRAIASYKENTGQISRMDNHTASAKTKSRVRHFARASRGASTTTLRTHQSVPCGEIISGTYCSTYAVRSMKLCKGNKAPQQRQHSSLNISLIRFSVHLSPVHTSAHGLTDGRTAAAVGEKIQTARPHFNPKTPRSKEKSRFIQFGLLYFAATDQSI